MVSKSALLFGIAFFFLLADATAKIPNGFFGSLFRGGKKAQPVTELRYLAIYPCSDASSQLITESNYHLIPLGIKIQSTNAVQGSPRVPAKTGAAEVDPFDEKDRIVDLGKIDILLRAGIPRFKMTPLPLLDSSLFLSSSSEYGSSPRQ
jgi:hypothetical protein